jgi:hypothetical protein
MAIFIINFKEIKMSTSDAQYKSDQVKGTLLTLAVTSLGVVSLAIAFWAGMT